jgi:hypothetical protein
MTAICATTASSVSALAAGGKALPAHRRKHARAEWLRIDVLLSMKL